MTDKIKPQRKTGVAHFFAAASYSFMGFQRLLQESAFRQETFAALAGLIALPLLGVELPRVLGFLILMLMLMAVEALNTALEEIVDHLSPEWSQFAKNAKDLGSFAVACLIGANALYLLWALFL
ncbi:diacylglycerol kinase [Thioclava sp. FR2]|uniref:diacylglycerol kinase n=1 Tax=Thioclava sp. FR2 TaxID=3445780 RepID=UPI003EBEFCAF